MNKESNPESNLGLAIPALALGAPLRFFLAGQIGWGLICVPVLSANVILYFMYRNRLKQKDHRFKTPYIVISITSLSLFIYSLFATM